jgi:hypothetical protein
MIQLLPRPELNLGAIACSPEETIERMGDLVATFNTLMGTKLTLEDTPLGGATDCKTFIRVPFYDREAYLICEHEISHSFAGTDLALTEVFREQAVERLLTRANIPITSPDAAPYRLKLNGLVHHLWNVLEDWRCCSVWGEVYFGGASLLQERWKLIAEYEMPNAAETDLAAYLGRLAAGTDTPTAPAEFQRCAPHMKAARAQVELVDNKACLAITARLIDAIADELLLSYPPDPTQPQTPHTQAISKLQALASALPPPPQTPTPPPPQPEPGKLGSKDLHPDPAQSKKTRKVPAKTMGELRKLMTASDKDGDAQKKSSLQKLLDDGTQKMNHRISAAKATLGAQTRSDQGQKEDLLLNAGRDCGIPTSHVTPIGKLPKPSKRAGGLRGYLEQVRLEQEWVSAPVGNTIYIPAVIQAKISKKLGSSQLFQRAEEVVGLQLLLLVDVSGSMRGHGLDMLERAIADVEYTCKDLPVDLHLWAFSSELYIFNKIGSPRDAPGVTMMLTSMVQALDVAVEWSRSGNVDRGVILITDGLPTSCRHRKSSGSPNDDLQTVMRELRQEGVVLSVLAIGSRTEQYDSVFGEKKYGLITGLADIPKALGDAARLIVEAHLKK